MPINTYRDFDFEEILDLLEKNKIQVIVVPDEENFYSITSNGDEFYISLYFDEQHLKINKKILIDLYKDDNRKIYQTLDSSDSSISSLMEKYIKKKLYKKYKNF
jgi:hypothetical protein